MPVVGLPPVFAFVEGRKLDVVVSCRIQDIQLSEPPGNRLVAKSITGIVEDALYSLRRLWVYQQMVLILRVKDVSEGSFGADKLSQCRHVVFGVFGFAPGLLCVALIAEVDVGQEVCRLAVNETVIAFIDGDKPDTQLREDFFNVVTSAKVVPAQA